MNGKSQGNVSPLAALSNINTADERDTDSHNLQDSFDELSIYLMAIRQIVDSESFKRDLAKYDSLSEVVKTKLRNRFYEFHGYYGRGFFDFVKQLRKVK